MSENTSDESKGIPVNDIWTDTGHIKSQSKENAEYPTQKPERLLERVIQATTAPGAIVFDCFMGSGTAQSVAKGAYKVPNDAGTIRVKITDLLSESWEGSVSNGR